MLIGHQLDASNGTGMEPALTSNAWLRYLPLLVNQSTLPRTHFNTLGGHRNQGCCREQSLVRTARRRSPDENKGLSFRCESVVPVHAIRVRKFNEFLGVLKCLPR
jgi:hypothetical protein